MQLSECRDALHTSSGIGHTVIRGRSEFYLYHNLASQAEAIYTRAVELRRSSPSKTEVPEGEDSTPVRRSLEAPDALYEPVEECRTCIPSITLPLGLRSGALTLLRIEALYAANTIPELRLSPATR